MSDDIRTRNDFEPALPEPPQKPTLPPTQKLAKSIWDDVFWWGVLGFALMAAKWELMTPADFGKAFFGVIFIKATMATGKGISLDALPFMKR